MLDEVVIQFNPATQLGLNLMLAALMFGVALNLKIGDFTRIVKRPVAPAIGLVCQFVILPALTCGLTVLLDVPASMALGMILVAACPGGNFSNLITFISKGNVATSVTMTAFSSVAAVVLTPLNFGLYAWLNPATRALLTDIALQPEQVLLVVVLVLAVPLAIGMWLGKLFPHFAERTTTPLRYFSLVIFLLFVAIAFFNNANLFAQYWTLFVWYVFAHNTLALLLGFSAAKLCGLSPEDSRAVTFEVGIQNSGLGLVLLFTFMPNLGGAIIITAFWGIWHLVSGTGLALFLGRKSNDNSNLKQEAL